MDFAIGDDVRGEDDAGSVESVSNALTVRVGGAGVGASGSDDASL